MHTREATPLRQWTRLGTQRCVRCRSMPPWPVIGTCLGWARQFNDRRWAVENARGLGCHLAQWLVAKDETVLDASTSATARVRELSRGGRRKNDVIDAAAAASVAAFQGDASLVVPEDTNGGVRFVGRAASESSSPAGPVSQPAACSAERPGSRAALLRR